MKPTIPLNLFTGFLGSGKTTTIINLIKAKPKQEKWGILINEFGDVPIDQTFVDGTSRDLFVKEIPGGCMCCDAWLFLQVALVRMIREFRPDRILVEMTGLGHPKSVISHLTDSPMQNAIHLTSTICLLDPNQYFHEKIYSYPSYVDQIAMADVVLITKSESVSSEMINQIKLDLERKYAPKDDIQLLFHQSAPLSILESVDRQERFALFPDFHRHSHQQPTESINAEENIAPAGSSQASVIDRGYPQRFENHGQDYMGCGWIFSSQDIFQNDKIIQVVNQIMDQGCQRLKGIFNTTSGVISINALPGFMDTREHDSTQDSRVEILCGQDSLVNWAEIEQQFLACLT